MLRNWFKKYFVPHKGNSYKPHLFREASSLGIFSLVILLFILAVSGRYILTRIDLTALVLPKVLVDYTNDDRSTEQYGHLAISTTLEKAAQLKANDMATKSYFAHNSPEGKNPWYWFEQAGYEFSYAGENLAVNFDDSLDVNKAWMKSPGHRANIMNKNFTEIGIATAEGMYEGRRTVFVVQLFGRPAAPTKVTPSVPTNTKPKPIPKTEGGVVAGVSQAVLSESVSTQSETSDETELFISVKKESTSIGTTTNLKYSNWFEKLLMSPKKWLSLSYLILSSLIILGLILMIFIEIKRQQWRYIFLGVGLLAIIIGLLYIYESVLFAPLLIV